MMKNFSKKFYGALFLFLLLLSSPSWGKPVAPDEAALAVRGWLAIDGRPLEESPGSVSGKVRMYGDSSEVFSGEKALYYAVFLEPRGIVFVPADDLVEPILAWQPGATDYDPGENGPFQALAIADLKARVKAARETTAKFYGLGAGSGSEERSKWNLLKTAKAVDGEMSAKSLSSVSDLRVEPLLKSAWAQSGTPPLYNYYTPKNYVTGCVATAVGQVLRYFKYPQAGIGAKTFSFTVDGRSQSGTTRGGDGRGGPYRWDGMPLQPDSAAITTAERQNIGALLSDIGMSIKAGYTSGETGAMMALAYKRLTDTFRYSNAAYGATVSRTQFFPIPADVLSRMINPNLDAGLPVLVGISAGNGGGHAIVADGYGYSASTLYHHLNMGWGGSDNVWYALPKVDASFSYNIVDECIYNLYQTGKGEIVSGRVLDASGAPVSGAAVALTGSATASATTNAKGVFAFAKLPSNGTYTLTAKKAGYTFGRQTVKTGRSVSPEVLNAGSVTLPGSNVCGNLWNVVVREGSGSDPIPEPQPAPSPGKIPVTGITVSPRTLTLGIGESYRPTVTLSPSNAADKTVTWTTSDKYVVGLVKDSAGRLYLRGVKAGTAKITFKADGGTNVSTSMNVTVRGSANVPVRGITVSPKTLTLGVGESYRPTVTLSPSNAANKAVTWTTSNKYVVALVRDSSGRLYLRGVKAGTAKITFKAEGGTNVSTSMNVTVRSKSSYSSGEAEEKHDAVDSAQESSAESENNDENEKEGCDSGLGLSALLPLTVFAARKRRPDRL
ncbi:MAG: C10 family peptidase [Synergistaceae bacterium]|jgi:hypothetical protein|nr:C10 family peptidase [Synergistaceae bacterium]